MFCCLHPPIVREEEEQEQELEVPTTAAPMSKPVANPEKTAAVYV